MKKIYFYRETAEGGAGAGGAGAPPAGDGGGQQHNNGTGGAPPAGQAPPAGAPGPGAYRPEGLPDHFLGGSDQETIDKMAKALNGFRQAQADRGEAPKDANGYEWTPDGAVKDYAEAAQDQVFDSFKGIAHKHGLTTKQFNGVVNDFLNNLIDGGLVDAPFNPDAEKALLAPDIKDPAERDRTVQALITENVAYVKTLEQQQAIDKPTADWLLSQADRAAMHKLVGVIKAAKGGETGPALGGQQSGALTKADLDARQADPRNEYGHPKYDRAFAQETTRLWAVYEQQQQSRRT
jgi:hypothetical protein